MWSKTAHTGFLYPIDQTEARATKISEGILLEPD